MKPGRSADRAARFLSTWCPPPYLSGCSLAARSEAGAVRLVRNYELSPELNEGLLLRSEWTDMPVMGMVEFLWGLSDGMSDAGLAVALAFGGRSDVSEGFGVTTILRYVLETCTGVPDALAPLARVPSHMAYNIVLADRTGTLASFELIPGGGLRRMERAIATNHQHGAKPAPPARRTSAACTGTSSGMWRMSAASQARRLGACISAARGEPRLAGGHDRPRRDFHLAPGPASATASKVRLCVMRPLLIPP